MTKLIFQRAVSCSLAAIGLAVASPMSFADQEVAVVAHLRASPGREAEAEARLRKVVEFVRKAEPNISYRLYRSKSDPAVFVFYEAYPSMAAIEQHKNVTLPAFAKQHGKPAQGLFSGPPQVERLEALVD